MAAVILPKQCDYRALVERTLEAFWISFLLMSHLKKDSIGCLTELIYLENRLSSSCRYCCLFFNFIGVKMTVLFLESC